MSNTWLANQELPVLYRNPLCITAFKRPRHWTLSWISYIHFTPLHSVSFLSVSVLSYLLPVSLPSVLYSSSSCDSFYVPFLYVPWTLYASSILYSPSNPQNTYISSFCTAVWHSVCSRSHQFQTFSSAPRSHTLSACFTALTVS